MHKDLDEMSYNYHKKDNTVSVGKSEFFNFFVFFEAGVCQNGGGE